VKREQRRAVLEGIIASDDPKVTGGDRLKALEQLERLEEQERQEELRRGPTDLRPKGDDEALAEVDQLLAAHVFALGYGGGHPETETPFPRTNKAIAEICAFWSAKGAKLGPPEAAQQPGEGWDDSEPAEEASSAASGRSYAEGTAVEEEPRAPKAWGDVLPRRTGGRINI
jgi:hypothetical protein